MKHMLLEFVAIDEHDAAHKWTSSIVPSAARVLAPVGEQGQVEIRGLKPRDASR